MDKETQGRAALEARAVLSELIDAAASNQLERLDAAIRKESARHPDLQDEATVLRQYKDANGRTALHFAAHAGQTEVCCVCVWRDAHPCRFVWTDGRGGGTAILP